MSAHVRMARDEGSADEWQRLMSGSAMIADEWRRPMSGGVGYVPRRNGGRKLLWPCRAWDS